MIIWCVLCENAHLFYQGLVGSQITPEDYYWITDWAMYSVKAVLSYSAAKTLSKQRWGKGPATIFYTLTVYYTIDVWNMLFWGNYDGLAPMLIGMAIAVITASMIHFHEKYEIISRTERKKIGF